MSTEQQGQPERPPQAESLPHIGAGTVYTETVVWSPPERYVNDAPYQIAIVDLGEKRVTGRILGERVAIGDAVEFVEERDGVEQYRRVPAPVAGA
jgi:uncharacterized OB-fold protein